MGSANELKRVRFVQEHSLRPSAMQQAAAMSLSNKLPMRLRLSLCAQGSCIYVTDKKRGSIGMIQCPLPTLSTPATQPEREPAPNSIHIGCYLTDTATAANSIGAATRGASGKEQATCPGALLLQ